MKHPRAAAVVAAAVILVSGVQLGAVAGTGHPLLLGQGNRASKTTSLKVTGKKSALRLKTASTVAPMKVTSSTKVRKLNADLVDGRSASELGSSSYTYDLPRGGVATTAKRVEFPGLPSGNFLVTYDILGVDADGVGIGTDPGVRDMTCWLRADTLSPAVDRIALSDGQNPVSATDVISVPEQPLLPPYMTCGAEQPFTFGATSTGFSQQSTVSFVPLGSVTAGTPSVS